MAAANGVTMKRVTPVHLVGSVPLPDAETVFEQVGAKLGRYLSRLPDGETGERGGWISFQRAMLEEHAAVMINPEGRTFPTRDLQGNVRRINELFVLNPDVPVEQIDFRPLGYSQAARESWRIFQQRQADGVIPANVRFQVSLPTPCANGLLYFHPDSHETYIDLMKQALLGEVAEICDAIPHECLAIQWDCCQEILQLEGYFPDDWTLDGPRMSRLVAQLGDAIPGGAEVGYHFCYGSPVDAPLVLQKDMGVAVDFCNAVNRQLHRVLNFVHLPVSDADAGDRFFRPLQNLELSPQTQIYLGLLHPKVKGGDYERIRIARQFLPAFGVATECGWGRKSEASVDYLLQMHFDAVAHDTD